MNIEQLQYALEVYRVGSISQAANNLFLSQPNLSASIQALEKELGSQIFIRTNKGVRPTEQGVLILEQAGLICESYQKMKRVSQLAHTSTLRVAGANYAPLSEAYMKFCILHQNENSHFSYRAMQYQSAIEQLYLSKADIALSLVYQDDLSGLAQRAKALGLVLNHLCKVPIVLRFGRNHPLYHQENIHFSDLYDYTLVVYNNRGFFRSSELRSMINANPDRIIYAGDMEQRRALVSNGTMYSVCCKLPQHLCEQSGFRDIPLGDLRCELVWLCRDVNNISSETHQYLDLVREEIKDL